MNKKIYYSLLTLLIFYLFTCKEDPTSSNIIDGPSEYGNVSDIDGNVYQTIKLGKQWWMAENLKTTHYQNGDSILNRTGLRWDKSLRTGAYAKYDSSYFYNWYAVDDNRNVAPDGWHVASKNEWNTLFESLGGDDIACEKMKSTSGWSYGNGKPGNGTNSSGFSVLPEGFYAPAGGNIANVGYESIFWTSSKTTLPVAGLYALWHVSFIADDPITGTFYNEGNESDTLSIYPIENEGYSVRCIKN